MFNQFDIVHVVNPIKLITNKKAQFLETKEQQVTELCNKNIIRVFTLVTLVAKPVTSIGDILSLITQTSS